MKLKLNIIYYDRKQISGFFGAKVCGKWGRKTDLDGGKQNFLE